MTILELIERLEVEQEKNGDTTVKIESSYEEYQEDDIRRFSISSEGCLVLHSDN